MSTHPLERLRPALDEVVGGAWRLEAELTPASQARVFTITHTTGRYVAKCFHATGAFVRERDALMRWGPALRDRVPALVAAIAQPLPTLVLEHVRGRVLAHTPAVLAATPRLFERAGRFWAQLQTQAVEPDPLALPDALALRFERWIRRGQAHLDPELRQAMSARFDPRIFAGTPRRACHRDFTPSNWMYDSDRDRLVVIDFGQARPDAALTDLVKLETETWSNAPRARARFLYGAQLDWNREHERQLAQLCLLHGLATTTWAAEHDDDTLKAHGLAVLRRTLGRI